MAIIRKSGAVLFAKHPQRVANFYATLAGMKVTYSGTDIIVLESPAHQLMDRLDEGNLWTVGTYQPKASR